MNLGIVFTVLFVIAAAARDVLFGGLFQAYRFFDIVLVAFGLAGVFFLSLVAWRQPEQFAALRRTWKDCVIANVGTAAAWTSFFFALKILEPAIVNTIHTGTGSVTLVILGALGFHVAKKARIRAREWVLQLGVLAALVALAAVVLLDLSGLRGRATGENLVGLALAFASGVFISLTSDVTKRMHERGVTAEGVLAVRFWAGIVLAALMVAAGVGDGRPLADPASLATVGAAGFLLIVLPLYLFQLGLARTSAVSVWVIQAVGPCLVFAGQLLDGRLTPSAWTLAAIAAYSVLVIAAALSRKYERA